MDPASASCCDWCCSPTCPHAPTSRAGWWGCRRSRRGRSWRGRPGWWQARGPASQRRRSMQSCEAGGTLGRPWQRAREQERWQARQPLAFIAPASWFHSRSLSMYASWPPPSMQAMAASSHISSSGCIVYSNSPSGLVRFKLRSCTAAARGCEQQQSCKSITAHNSTL